MEFKVYHTNAYRNICSEPVGFDNNSNVEKHIFHNGFHCFRLLNEHNIGEKGIEKIDHELMSSRKFFAVNDAKRVISIAYVLINTNTSKIYAFNYSEKKIKDLLYKYFSTLDINSVVEPNKLAKITHVDVKIKKMPQDSLVYRNYSLQELDVVKELEIQDDSLVEFEAKYTLDKQGSFFSKDKLKKFLLENNNAVITGVDDQDNIIKLGKVCQLIITIDLEATHYDEILALSMHNLIDLINSKELKDLNDY